MLQPNVATLNVAVVLTLLNLWTPKNSPAPPTASNSSSRASRWLGAWDGHVVAFEWEAIILKKKGHCGACIGRYRSCQCPLTDRPCTTRGHL